MHMCIFFSLFTTGHRHTEDPVINGALSDITDNTDSCKPTNNIIWSEPLATNSSYTVDLKSIHTSPSNFSYWYHHFYMHSNRPLFFLYL